MDDITVSKSIISCSNQKPRMTVKAPTRRRIQGICFTTGDKVVYVAGHPVPAISKNKMTSPSCDIDASTGSILDQFLFNISPSVVCFKLNIILLMMKDSSVSFFNDYSLHLHPLSWRALRDSAWSTPRLCCDSDPLQFTHHANRHFHHSSSVYTSQPREKPWWFYVTQWS